MLKEMQQCAKKVMSNIPGLVDFTIGVVDSILNLPTGKWSNGEFNFRLELYSILPIKMFSG